MHSGWNGAWRNVVCNVLKNLKKLYISFYKLSRFFVLLHVITGYSEWFVLSSCFLDDIYNNPSFLLTSWSIRSDFYCIAFVCCLCFVMCVVPLMSSKSLLIQRMHLHCRHRDDDCLLHLITYHFTGKLFDIFISYYCH